MDYKFIKIYSDFLKKKLEPKKPLKIIFDCSNGITSLVLKKLLTPKTQNLKSIFINDKPNGNFPAHGPNPLAKNALNQLQKKIIEQKADLGIIFDADGDRVFFIDNLRQFIHPDIIANLLIWHLNPKKIVIDTRIGWLVKKLKIACPARTYPARESFLTGQVKLKISRIGHFYIKKLMRKTDTDFGAETSGHYYFTVRKNNKNDLYYDDGILAAIEIINAVSKLPYSLADFANLLPQYYRSGEINIKNEKYDSKFENLLDKIKNKFKNCSKKISHIDGLTMDFNDWWFNLRPSNTEPLIRLNIEADNKKLLQQKIKEIKQFLK